MMGAASANRGAHHMPSTGSQVRAWLATAAGCLLLAGALHLAGASAFTGVPVVAAFLALALAARATGTLGAFGFTFSIFAFVAAALFYPWAFRTWFGFPLSTLITPLIQVIMFGMGTTLSVGDFARVIRVPRAVAIGIVLQFLIMPVTGYTLARLFAMQGEVAAGVVLVGSSPGGVASNVITYLAGGNVPLSVTMTACSTMLSPLLTPLAMQQLAGQYVPISFVDMMWAIVRMIILPIVAGLVVNKLLMGRTRWLHRALPIVSMAAICFIIAIITALSRDQLLAVAGSLIAIVVLHNCTGYLLGYFGARALGLDERDARTVSIEVGLQNAGMASGLAIGVLRSSHAGLAPAIFGPWMNISGSVLASLWRRQDVSAVVVAPGAAPTQRQT
jgi:bile acid:Na+ symporter, BASS family